MISPEQCRAARAWLGWPQPELATRTTVRLSTVRDFEPVTRTPILTHRAAIHESFAALALLLAFTNSAPPLGIPFFPP